MGKIEKKRAKLQERIEYLQNELKSELGKKTSSTKEIDLPTQLRKIAELQKELIDLSIK